MESGDNLPHTDEDAFLLYRAYGQQAGEDCLRVHVWTPEINGSKKRPVMVYMHGGGFTVGCGHDLLAYDGEIARHVQLSKTSVFRLLRTLEAAGYVTTSGWGKYALVPGVQSIVSTHWLARLLRTATPLLQELTRELHETASLAALFDNRIEVIAITESPQAVRMSNVVGHIVPPNASSSGKTITAFQSEERREKLLRSHGTYRFTDHTMVDRSDLCRARQYSANIRTAAQVALQPTDRLPVETLANELPMTYRQMPLSQLLPNTGGAL